MFVPDGGGSVAALRTVELTLDEIRRIGTQDLPAAKGKAKTGLTRFAGARIPAGAFGQSDRGRALAATHASAHSVFRETIEGVIADLEDFRQKLLDSVKAYESTDDAVTQALTTIGKDVDTAGPSHADQAQQRGVDRHARDLPLPPAAPAAPVDAPPSLSAAPRRPVG